MTTTLTPHAASPSRCPLCGASHRMTACPDWRAERARARMYVGAWARQLLAEYRADPIDSEVAFRLAATTAQRAEERLRGDPSDGEPGIGGPDEIPGADPSEGRR